MKYICFLFIFLNISCTVHSYREEKEYDRLLGIAKLSWKNQEGDEKVDFHFNEVIWWTEVNGDDEKKAWTYHEWGRYYLAKLKFKRGIELFFKSAELFPRHKNSYLQYLNLYNLAFVEFKNERRETGCELLGKARLVLRDVLLAEYLEENKKARLRSRQNSFSDLNNCTYGVL